jgi:DNA helicase-2/ATP-dependent DNA helicase PcrA
VLDEWEVDNIFNAEFSDAAGLTPTRCDEIRRHHEAMWSTGVWDPPNYVPPAPPISAGEIGQFTRFHGPLTETYACVLPGELVRQCVDAIDAGLLDPKALLGIDHLIVDEYQDLNPYDQRFVEGLTSRGVTTFVAGDDDQSIYSFRFASPSGIQSYHADHPGSASHELDQCFRCTPEVVASASRLINRYSPPGRVPKALTSLYERSAPPNRGLVHAWQFSSDLQEARGIAESCRSLLDLGVAPRQILILLSNSRLQATQLENALTAAGVPHEMPTSERFVDRDAGRALLSLIRIGCDREDYIAHRTLLGLRSKVGPRTCRQILERVVTENRNYLDLFYGLAPLTSLGARQRGAIDAVAAIVADTVGWAVGDELSTRIDALVRLVTDLLNDEAGQAVRDVLDELPGEITLGELRDYFWADKDEAQARILFKVHQRAGRPLEETAVLPARVRVMSMHGAKGLSAQVVMLPGVEEQVLPGDKRRPYPGLVLEAARLLYVSITRARAACLVTYSTHRLVYGRRVRHAPSQYLGHLGRTFRYRATGLLPAESTEIVDAIRLL